MRILVCGGRDFDDSRAMYAALDRVNVKHGITCIIHGCARGADHLANIYAEHINAKREMYEAEWELFGKKAGPMRNQSMIDLGKPDACVAFPGGRGTADMIARCKKAGIPVWRANNRPFGHVTQEDLQLGPLPIDSKSAKVAFGRGTGFEPSANYNEPYAESQPQIVEVSPHKLVKMNAVGIPGKRIGKLTVVGRADKDACQLTQRGKWVCRCDCGWYVMRTTKALRIEDNRTYRYACPRCSVMELIRQGKWKK